MTSHHAERLLTELHASLGLRKRPEDVARLVLDLFTAQGVELDPVTENALGKAAENSLRSLWHGYTSIPVFAGNPGLWAGRECDPWPGGAKCRSSLRLRGDGQSGRFWFSM
ncbi:hypothetical protein ACFUJR_33495 [Streptomyces sp. NPDC057271]|uniref:hypothetical protein n=1 Tax=unclassified Streptomyces TaxID=2593676 RepID=UPI00363C5862